MKPSTEVLGGWSWYVRMVKENNPTAIINYKDLMDKYIKGVKWEDAL